MCQTWRRLTTPTAKGATGDPVEPRGAPRLVRSSRPDHREPLKKVVGGCRGAKPPASLAGKRKSAPLHRAATLRDALRFDNPAWT